MLCWVIPTTCEVWAPQFVKTKTWKKSLFYCC
jgi:hypothetical protein